MFSSDDAPGPVTPTSRWTEGRRLQKSGSTCSKAGCSRSAGAAATSGAAVTVFPACAGRRCLVRRRRGPRDCPPSHRPVRVSMACCFRSCRPGGRMSSTGINRTVVHGMRQCCRCHRVFDPAATLHRYMRGHPDVHMPFTPAANVVECNECVRAHAPHPHTYIHAWPPASQEPRGWSFRPLSTRLPFPPSPMCHTQPKRVCLRAPCTAPCCHCAAGEGCAHASYQHGAAAPVPCVHDRVQTKPPNRRCCNKPDGAGVWVQGGVEIRAVCDAFNSTSI